MHVILPSRARSVDPHCERRLTCDLSDRRQTTDRRRADVASAARRASHLATNDKLNYPHYAYRVART